VVDEQVDEQEAARALATVRARQEQTRRAARMPWWVYAVMFVLVVLINAINDVVTLTGSKVVAGVVLLLLVVTMVANFLGKSAPLSRLRGVQSRQVFHPRVFIVVAVVGGVAGWLIIRFGSGFTWDVARAVGLPGYPGTVFGVLCGIVFTALFALSQALTNAANARSAP
jgi:hypothetical protein